MPQLLGVPRSLALTIQLYLVDENAGMSVLLDASPEGAASRLVSISAQGVRCVAVKAEHSVLIHPDAYIAWVDEKKSVSGLEEALNRWFIPA